MRYGELVDIGRHIVEQRVERPAAERAARWTLKQGLTSPLFAPALKLGQLARPFLPAALQDKVPKHGGAAAHRWPTRTHPRKVLLLMGCVQPAMMPNINSATARVLDACGIQTLVADDAGCCGALRTHLADRDGGLADMRRNIDAWWPLVEGLTAAGRVEAIVMNASGCGVTVKEYGQALAHDPHYADKAQRIAALTRDLSELLPELVPKLKPRMALRQLVRSADWRCTRRARCSTGSSCAAASRPACANSASRSSCPPTATCAAARPAPTRCCSPSWRSACATASWPIWRRSSPTPSSRPTSAASSTCRRHRHAGAALGRGGGPGVVALGFTRCRRAPLEVERHHLGHHLLGHHRNRQQPAEACRGHVAFVQATHDLAVTHLGGAAAPRRVQRARATVG